MDETYQLYLNRVARQTLPATYESQLQHIQESSKFKPDSHGQRQPVSFPGYSVISTPGKEDSDNSKFYSSLNLCQQQLLERLGRDIVVPVPPDSFHLTLADLIWDGAFRHASENPEFEEQLRSRIAGIFEQLQSSETKNNPIGWQPLGLMVMPRALVVCLVPKTEESYERILQFRRSIYQNSGLMALGIEQQYGFTAHITLGYFGEISPSLDRDRFGNTLCELNQQWQDNEPPELWIHRAELRKFDDMTRYYREPDWPVFEF